MKKCSCCKELKPVSEFPPNRSKKDGLQTECRECRGIIKRNTLNTNNIKSLEYMGCECQDCGVRFEYPKDKDQYHFHHVNPLTKIDNVSRIIARRSSWKLILEELKKCVLLCKPCHMKRHTDFNRGLRPTL
jgi:hypothetical protein